MNAKLKSYLIKGGLFLLTGTGIIVGGWFALAAVIAAINAKVPVNVSVPATPAVEIRSAPTVRVSSAPVRAYRGDAPARLKLPPEVLANPAQQVIAAAQVRATDRPQTVTTVLNTETGDAQSFVRQDPYPWLAIETRGEARLAYGYKYSTNGQIARVARLGVSYDAVRIKALTAGVVATVDSDGSAFAGVSIAYRF